MAADEDVVVLPVCGRGEAAGISDFGGAAEQGSRGDEEEEEEVGEAEAPRLRRGWMTRDCFQRDYTGYI